MNIIIEPIIANESRALDIQRVFDPELFAQIKACWKKAAHQKSITSSQIAAWAIIRGADPKKGFTPITNAAKLANGQDAFGAYDSAMRSCERLARSALTPWERLLLEQGCEIKGYQWSGAHPLLRQLGSPRA